MNMGQVKLLPASNESEIGKIEKLTSSFASILAECLRDEFKTIHLSGQIMDEIHISTDGKGVYSVEINPRIYDVWSYKKKGIMKHTSPNSYALDVDTEGGFSGMHVGYVYKCIQAAWALWSIQNGIKSDVKLNMTKW